MVYFPSRIGQKFLMLKSFLKVFILGMGLVDFPLCRRSLFRAFVKTDESGESPPIFGAETAHAWFSQVFRIDVTLRKIFSSRTFTSGEGTYWYTALKKCQNNKILSKCHILVSFQLWFYDYALTLVVYEYSRVSNNRGDGINV